MQKPVKQNGKLIIKHSQSTNNQAKGRLFESLSALLLESLGYKIDRIPNSNYAGMEIDIEAKHSVFNTPLYVECKYYESKIDSPKFQAFFGKYMARWMKNKRSQGIFVAIPSVNSHVKTFHSELAANSNDIQIEILDEPDVINIIQLNRTKIRSGLIDGLLTPNTFKIDNWELIFSDLGIYWRQYLVAPGKRASDRYFVVNEIGLPLNEREAIALERALGIEITEHSYLNIMQAHSGSNAAQNRSIASWIDSDTDFIQDFLLFRASQGSSKRTVKGYELDLRASERICEKKLASFNSDDIEKVVSITAQGGKSSNTVRKRFEILRAFYKYLINKEILIVNPTYGIKVPRATSQDVQNQLSQREIDQFIAAFKSDNIKNVRDSAIAGLVIYLGLKPSEIADIDLSDIDLRKKSIYLRSRDYTLPIQKSLETLIRSWVDIHPIGSGAMFVGKNRKNEPWKKLTYDGLRHGFNLIVDRSGIDPKRVTFNSIRNTLVTKLMKNNNLAIEDVQLMLGYKNVAQLGRYTTKKGLDHVRAHID